MQFMRLAGSASVSSLGIDISTSSVTVIELAKFENTLSLLAYCRLPFPEESAFEEASEATSARAGNCRRPSYIGCQQQLRSVGVGSGMRRQTSRSAARADWRVITGGDGNRSRKIFPFPYSGSDV